MEITLDISKMTAAEVDLVEDTLNEHMPARFTGVIEFGDLVKQFAWERDCDQAETEGRPPPPFPVGVVKVPKVKALRAIELVQLRRDNPRATWDDTGKDPLWSNLNEPDPTPPVVPDPPAARSWPTPTPEPSAQPA